MRFSRTRQQMQRVLLCLWPVVAAEVVMTGAASQTAEGIRRGFWWWLALGLSGLFIVLLMFLLLFFWTCSLNASGSVAASPRHSGCHQLEKQDGVGPFDSDNTFSPSTTAMRRGSNDIDNARCGTDGAAASLLQYANHTEGRSNIEMRVTVFGGTVPSSYEGECSAPRQLTTTVATMRVPGYTSKKVALASSRRWPPSPSRSTAAAVPQHDVPTTPPRYLTSSHLPGTACIPKQLQPSAVGRYRRSPDGLGGATLDADVGVVVNSLESLPMAAELHNAKPSPTARLAGSAAPPSTLEAMSEEVWATGDTPRDIPVDEPTLSGAPAIACDGTVALQPKPATLPQDASLKLQRSGLPNAVKQYYFGVKRVQGTSAATASSVLMPQCASHDAAYAPPQHRSSLVGRCPVAAYSKPAPSLSRKTPTTDATTTAAAAAAPASLTPHGGAVFNPLTLMSAAMRTVARLESGDSASLTDVDSFPKKLHVVGTDGAAATGAAAHSLSVCRESKPALSPSRSKRRLELFRVGGERSSAAVKKTVSGAQLNQRPVARLDSTEDRPTQQRLLPQAASVLTGSRTRRHRRNHRLLSQPPARSRDGASSSSAFRRTASAGDTAAKQLASTTVMEGVPKLFFDKRGTSPVRPADAAAPFHPKRALPNGAGNGRGGAAVHRPPIPKILPGGHLTQTPVPPVVASSLLSSVSPRSRTVAATAASILHDLSTTAAATAKGGGSIKSSRPAAAPRRGSLSFSLSDRSPLRSASGRMRSSNLVTFLDNDNVCVRSGFHDGHASSLLAQHLPLLKCRKEFAKLCSLSYAPPSAGDCAGAARLERLSDPLLPTATTLPLTAPAPANVDMTVTQGHRSFGPPHTTSRVERLQAQSPAAGEPSEVATATPLELPNEVAACRTPAALAPPVSFTTCQEGYCAAAAALTPASAVESGDLVAHESSDSEDSDSLKSQASTIAAGMLPGVPRDQRGVATTVSPAPKGTSHQQQLRSGASASSTTSQRLSHSLGIQVLRITHPTGAVQEAPVPSSALAQRSPHHDAMNTISYYPSKASIQHLRAPHGSAALPVRPPSSPAHA